MPSICPTLSKKFFIFGRALSFLSSHHNNKFWQPPISSMPCSISSWPLLLASSSDFCPLHQESHLLIQSNLNTQHCSAHDPSYTHTFLNIYKLAILLNFNRPKIKHLVLINNFEIIVMVLPLLKLGTLALKTLSKPVASRLKQQAAIHPRFRQLIIGMAQVLNYVIPYFYLHKHF